LITLVLLAVISFDLAAGGLFLQLVNFRALSGWESEIAFDSLTFNWNLINWAVRLLNLTAFTGILSSLYFKGFYRVWGAALSALFLANAFYPSGLAFHYLTGFHFILLFGILSNVGCFVVLAFLKKRSGLLGSAWRNRKKMEDIAQIDVAQAKELFEAGATFVDVRDPASFEAAHIPGAFHLSDANVEAFVAKSDKTHTVVVYCYHGNASQGGAAYLMEQGFQKVYSVIGGFERWRQTEKIES
jgi:thiosulfate sulfurtransferase